MARSMDCPHACSCVPMSLRAVSGLDLAHPYQYASLPFATAGSIWRYRMLFAGSWGYVTPILLLVCSNVFMTLAWYGHLSFKSRPLLLVVVVSWGIAFAEYCLAVPANRYGHTIYSAAELKTIQEVVTLVVFAGFSALYLKEPLGWNHAVGFALIAAGAAFVFSGRA